MKLLWANFFHIYQPPDWDPNIIRRVARESYVPLLTFLRENPRVRLTLNVTGSLLEQLYAHGMTEPIEHLKELVRRGQVELTMTPKYHPLSPLLPFPHVARQIEAQQQLMAETFGSLRPVGFYPPEMAVTREFLRAVAGAGYRWVISDDFLLPKGFSLTPEQGAVFAGTNLRLVFRNHTLSDYLGFFAEPGEKLAHFKELIVKETGQERTILTGMDGENLGHHRPESLPMWKALVMEKGVNAVTVSEFLEGQTGIQELVPRSGSWSTLPEHLDQGIPFPLWKDPENPIHTLQWRLTETVLNIAERIPYDGGALERIDRALVSDQYWWASAAPWWDRDIVVRLTDRLGDAVRGLELTGAEQKEIRRTVQAIHETADRWQEEGTAERRRKAFLAKEGGVRYFGGERISDTWR